MLFVLTTLGGIVGAAIFGVAAMFVMGALAEAGGASGMNGGSAMVAVVVGIPIGVLIGTIVGVWVALRLKHRASVRAVAGHSAVSLTTMAGIGAAIFAYMYFDQDIIAPNRLPPQLEFEVRLPSTFKIPERRDRMKIDLETDKNTMPAEIAIDSPRPDGDKIVVSGIVEVYFRTSERLISVKFPDEPELLFRLDLAANPKHMPQIGPWRRIDRIAADASAPSRRASPSDDYEIRYRLDRRESPP